MAIYWLLSLVCLLTPLSSAAQGYSGGGLADETVTKSVTETITKYLSQCGTLETPSHTPDITLSGTTTLTSSLQATTFVTIISNVTNHSEAAPIGSTLSQSDSTLRTPNITPTALTTESSYPASHYSSTHANTTKIPCSTSTSTLLVPVPPGSSSHSTPCTTSFRSTYSTSAPTTSPTQIPVSGSARLRGVVATRKFLGVLTIVSVLIAGFL
ncbi:hypothetical protein F4813DRAFT_191985 [Daldinia decipiens]|uniref:uncharacterized protein n=1 Tax=Daldinia decipiens TaxID=326647 RepID=UPI0020C38DC9|nr:uncharacterized protein F4813DRAFT_191985 [Daldinia decipiens]KAI1654921.1 hypothetical protein F4813DRAFT_191985 [Daldinia decipiens]